MSLLGFQNTAIANDTLQQALEEGGGGVFALGRAAAAAYLNLLASGVSATTAQAQIRALVLANNTTELERLVNDSRCTLSFPNNHAGGDH